VFAFFCRRGKVGLCYVQATVQQVLYVYCIGIYSVFKDDNWAGFPIGRPNRAGFGPGADSTFVDFLDFGPAC
jgi:hypothetical protein